MPRDRKPARRRHETNQPAIRGIAGLCQLRSGEGQVPADRGSSRTAMVARAVNDQVARVARAWRVVGGRLLHHLSLSARLGVQRRRVWSPTVIDSRKEQRHGLEEGRNPT